MGASEHSELVERRVTKLLQPYFTDLFAVSYMPSFPRRDKSTFSIFQVVFAVGPGEEAATRTSVHDRFRSVLRILSTLPAVQQVDIVALRARRHVPPKSRPDHPHMFIECTWPGSMLLAMHDDDFSNWHSHCSFYVNRFDKSDQLNIDRRKV